MSSDSLDARQWRLRETFLTSDGASFLTQLRQDPQLDINYIYGEPVHEPLLMTACRRRDTSRITLLRRAGADFNARDLMGDRTALLWAAEQAELVVLEHLLAKPDAEGATEETSFIAPALELNARDRGDGTPLHLLVAAAGRPTTADAALKGIGLLASCPGVDLDAKDERGRTPLVLALEAGLVQPVLAIAEAGAALPADIRPRLEAEPRLKSLLEAVGRPPRRRPAAQQLWEAVHQSGEVEAVRAALDRLPTDLNGRQLAMNAPFALYTCLQWAVLGGRADLARLLLDAGAPPAKASAVYPQPPLLYAAELGDAALLEVMLAALRKPPDLVDLVTLRDSGARGLGETALHKAARHGPAPVDADFDRCMSLLLCEHVDANCANSAGETPLHVALRAGFGSGALRLLTAGASLAVPDNRGVMPIDLVRPDTLKAALDGCVRLVPPPPPPAPPLTENGLTEKPPPPPPDAASLKRHQAEEDDMRLRAVNCEMEVDFTCLAPVQRPQKTPEMPVLMRMRANPQLRQLLQHPVLLALLYLKYDRSRWFYYVNVLLFLGFTVLLTLFVFGADGRAELGAWTTSTGVRAALTGGLALLTLRELLQMVITGPFYFLSMENWIELAVLALGYPLLWASLTPPTAQHLSAWLMVTTWLEVAMNMGRTPALAPYKTMMENIALSFGRLIFLYFGLVMAFAIAFFLVFRGVDSFSTFSVSMPKAIAMATGEFDYGDLSETMKVDEAAGVGRTHVLSSVLLFILFLFLIFIVLMNLLTSLAVDDTQAISQQAAIMEADNRILLLGYIENFFLLSYLPAALKRRDGSLRAAADAPCTGFKERVRRRVLLFHSAMANCRYSFFPNRQERDVTCRDIAHACGERQGGLFAQMCFRWFTLDGCLGEKPRELCELPMKMREELLNLVLKPQSLEEKVDQLQAALNQQTVLLSKLLESQKATA